MLDKAKLENLAVNQLQELGFTGMNELRGKSIFDLGCGSPAYIVEFLRMNGIFAEGADKFADSSSYLHQATFDGVETKIPGENYDTIIANLFPPFYLENDVIAQRFEELGGNLGMNSYGTGPAMAKNAIDLLSQGGELRMFPHVPKLDSLILGHDPSVTVEIKETGLNRDTKGVVDQYGHLTQEHFSHVSIYRKG